MEIARKRNFFICNSKRNFSTLLTFHKTVNLMVFICVFAGIMAAAPRWDKLSPNEFQQLQDLASCEYNFLL